MLRRMLHILWTAIRTPRIAYGKFLLKGRVLLLHSLNRFSTSPVTGEGGVVVNLTSFSHRVATVHLALETIARGKVRPRRLILWLDDAKVVASPPRQLQRMIDRGLEVLICEDFGPHKKQYAFALTRDETQVPLAVADDDVLYPRSWLEGLLMAYGTHPTVVNGYRAHTIAVRYGAIAPYASWSPCAHDMASFSTMCTGVSGIIYPVALINALRAEGTKFRDVAPLADDVWVHSVATRVGIRTRQLSPSQAEFPAIPGTQKGTLNGQNVRAGGNDRQISASYGPEEIEAIAADLAVLHKSPLAREQGSHSLNE